MLRENHPPLINLSFFRLYLYQHVMVRFAPYGHFFTDLPDTETRTSRLGGFPGRDEEEMYVFTLRLNFSHQEIP